MTATQKDRKVFELSFDSEPNCIHTGTSSMAHKNKSNYSAYKDRQNKKTNALSKAESPPPSAPKKAANSSPSAKTAHPAKPLSSAILGSAPPKTLLGKHKKPQEIYSLEEANDRLYDVFRNHDFTQISHEQRKQLAHFYQLLMQNQKDENFTRLLTLKDIAIKHFIDSLVFLDFYQPQFPLLDLGTGPGFPGLPLKIKFPKEKNSSGRRGSKASEFP